MRDPWLDEQERQEQLEAHMAKFPICTICGRSLMNCDVIVKIKEKYYCDMCADVMTNDEMRDEVGIE